MNDLFEKWIPMIGWIILWYLATTFLYLLNPDMGFHGYIVIGLIVASLIINLRDPKPDPPGMRF